MGMGDDDTDVVGTVNDDDDSVEDICGRLIFTVGGFV